MWKIFKNEGFGTSLTIGRKTLGLHVRSCTLRIDFRRTLAAVVYDTTEMTWVNAEGRKASFVGGAGVFEGEEDHVWVY